jgi:hypothetical protein
MSRRIANSTLNASTIDILNVIRQNASYDYQQNVPEVTTVNDIPKVGEIIYGTPAFSNQFINALVNRIAIVRVQSATFNNPYSILKKGYIEYGETVEDIFVSITKAVDFNVEKAAKREFQRTIPDVRSAFHVMNWRVMYPVTIQDEDLRQAFLSIEGVQNIIAKIVDAVYTAAEYDEFLLFKYLLIKAISHGKMCPISIGAGADLSEAAVQFRGTSNLLPFMSSDYNEAGVKTNTPKERQVIFMDAMFNAQFDVNVLASAFNMDKADFMGRLFLIDNWTDFDNERFDIIRANSDGIEEVTADELALLANVKAVILDDNWFQVYDNNNKFTEKYVASGLYWNYFYHTWKTVSNSPFANAVVFATSAADVALPATVTVHVDAKDESDVATVFTISADFEEAGLNPQNVNFVQTEALTTAGIAVQKYGELIIPASQVATDITLVAEINGTTYTADTTINGSTAVDANVTLNKN